MLAELLVPRRGVQLFSWSDVSPWESSDEDKTEGGAHVWPMTAQCPTCPLGRGEGCGELSSPAGAKTVSQAILGDFLLAFVGAWIGS